jgi:ferritin-like metal-binding protein YciE
MQVRIESKERLEQIKQHLRETTNPNASMTLVVEQLINKEHKRLKLCPTDGE